VETGSATHLILRNSGNGATRNLEYENIMSSRTTARCHAMTPEEALRNILKLVEGSDEVEDSRALQILLQSIKTLAEKGLGRSE
jgi:hypothetical protein